MSELTCSSSNTELFWKPLLNLSDLLGDTSRRSRLCIALSLGKNDVPEVQVSYAIQLRTMMIRTQHTRVAGYTSESFKDTEAIMFVSLTYVRLPVG